MKIYQKTASGMQLLSDGYTKDQVDEMINQIKYKEEITPETATKIVLYSTLEKLVYKNGEEVSDVILSLAITKGTPTITKIALYVNDVLVKDDFEINTDSGVEKFNARYTYEGPITSDTEFVFKVYDTEQLNIARLKVTFVVPSYYGAIDSIDVGTIDVSTTLTEILLEDKAFDWTDITEANKIFCYAYPASMGELSSIVDENNFNMMYFFNKTTTMVGEVEYNLYYASSTASLTNGRLTFS